MSQPANVPVYCGGCGAEFPPVRVERDCHGLDRLIDMANRALAEDSGTGHRFPDGD